MVRKIARGTYVLVVTTLVVAWVFSLAKEAPAQPGQPQPAEQIWYLFA
jgi:hypothetical protein